MDTLVQDWEIILLQVRMNSKLAWTGFNTYFGGGGGGGGIQPATHKPICPSVYQV